jgi:hypothetical protein
MIGVTKENDDKNLSEETTTSVNSEVRSTLSTKKRGRKGGMSSLKRNAVTETVVPPRALPTVVDTAEINAVGTEGSTVILNN